MEARTPGREVLARSGEVRQHTVTFEVTRELLERDLARWSQPVRFRFEEREGGGHELVMTTNLHEGAEADDS